VANGEMIVSSFLPWVITFADHSEFTIHNSAFALYTLAQHRVLERRENQLSYEERIQAKHTSESRQAIFPRHGLGQRHRCGLGDCGAT
jgi:hypothetical protein